MELTPLLIPMLTAGCVLLIAVALRAGARNRVSAAAVAMGRNAVPDLRELKLRQPWSERVLKPLLRRLYRMGRYFTPSRAIAQLQENLVTAGLPGGLTVTDFLGLRFLAGACVATVAFTVMIMRQPPTMTLAASIGGFLLGMYMPNMWLTSKARARQKAIARALPDMLDMMSICVDAGLGFEAAMQKVAYQSNNELALEMRRVISEIRVGVSRADALRHLAERTKVPEVASFVAVLVQADKLGVAIRNVLATQSVQMRIHRRQMAEEAAGKAPIKMLIPLVLFIFPALFAVLLGPAVPRIMAAF
ncbi:MAG TPA: type II secretion system F family protein [Caldilineaceae bacterium]|nr:type II secretion system F family protein [Caldilineaceae bacterium]